MALPTSLQMLGGLIIAFAYTYYALDNKYWPFRKALDEHDNCDGKPWKICPKKFALPFLGVLLVSILILFLIPKLMHRGGGGGSGGDDFGDGT